MAQELASSPREVAETVFAWVRGADRHQVESQAAHWGPGHWREAEHAAVRHGLAPQLHTVLHQGRAQRAVDRAFARALATCSRLTRRRGTLVTAETKRLLALGAERGVPLVLLKDTALACHGRGDPALRPTAGVHLLVRPRDLTRFTCAVARAGWRHVVRSVGPPVMVSAEFEGPDHPVDGDQADAPVGLQLHTSIDQQSGGIHFDLTWAYWYEARRAFVDGVPCLTPSPLRLMQHLLILVSEGLMALELRVMQLWHLAIVAEVLDSADWETLVEEATNQGEARLFWAPLRLAERYVGPIAPEDVMAAMRRRVPPALRDWTDTTSAFDCSAATYRQALPADRTRWCRSSWETMLVLRQALVPLPNEMPAPGFARVYYHHVRRLARWLRFGASSWSARRLSRPSQYLRSTG